MTSPLDRNIAHLRNLWYFALPGATLKRGRMTAKVLLGEPILLARDNQGQPFAIRNICPHRGIPLTHGRFDGTEVECGYHGWRFNGEGRCTAIPSLTDDQKLDVTRIKVRRYPCREVQGNIWVFFGDENRDPGDPPEVPDIGNQRPRLVETQVFDCEIDHAVVGLMDPAHGPYVHAAWWWRSRRSMHEKAKTFAPAPLGFQMVRHKPSSNSAGYKVLGGEITTEITFKLPGVRVEHIRAGRHVLCNLTAVTPTGEGKTVVNHAIYWTQPWLTPLTPIFRRFAKTFLGQDRVMVTKQQEGLRYNPNLMLINDADTQAKWYYRLKKEWQRCEAEGGEFVNPVKEATLRWRS